MVLHLVLAAFLTLAALAALVGVYQAHFLDIGLTFGTTSGSLSLIAFGVTLMFWLQQVKACMVKCEFCGK